MTLTCTGNDKNQLVTGLAALLLSDCSAEITAENLSSVINASGNTVPAYYPTLYAAFIEKSHGVEKFMNGPSAGGAPAAASAGPAAAAPAAAKVAEKPKVEEVDALDGGMDMFGGGGGGGGDY